MSVATRLLRACGLTLQLSVCVQVPEDIVRPDYAGTGYPASEVDSRQQRSVAIRSPEEIAGIREACR